VADRQPGGVQSVDRAFELLEVLAEAGGELALSEIAASSALPLPTIHRLVRTLVNRGYVRQLPSRRYALGPRLINLGERASGMLGDWARPWLTDLVEALGETTNLSMIDGNRATYVAQVPSRHSMRMFTEVGRRVYLHCTGVGKALLAQRGDDEVLELLHRAGMPAQTAHTIVDPDTLLAQIRQIRQVGYALDDGEQEIGVRCVAVPVLGGPSSYAISVSGPSARMTADLVDRAVPLMRTAAKELSSDLSEVRPSA
jgi:IclR family transcriptional regulator, acetate operon repressor